MGFRVTPVTFHEIRPQAARQWSERRGEGFAKALSGHKSAVKAQQSVPMEFDAPIFGSARLRNVPRSS